MPFRYRNLEDLDGEWQGQIARVSRLVAKPAFGQALLAAVADAVRDTHENERVYVGFHAAPDGRTVVLLHSVWANPAAVRTTADPSTPLHFARYADLVDTWTMEYFEEYLDWLPTPADDAER